jgi:hypothetical protein
MTIARKLTLSAALLVACGDDRNPDDETVERAVEPGRYEVTAENVVLRPKDGSYAIGNLRQGATMDVHEVNGDGWAWGFAYARSIAASGRSSTERTSSPANS